MIFQQLLNKAASHPRRLFLVDGIGALVSASFLGLIMPRLEHIFGMPPSVLYVLASIAAVFMVYSFSCYFRFPKNWRGYLKGISMANFLYCCLTLGLVIWHFDKLSILGAGYFVGEMVIVLVLVMVELKITRYRD